MRLHPITWLLVLAAALHLVGDAFYVGENLAALPAPSVFGNIDPPTRIEALYQYWARWFHAIALSLNYFAAPATVEFLIRIWRELRERRTVADFR